MISSCVGPKQKSRPWRSFKRASSGPYFSQRPVSCHNSAGCNAGINTSNASTFSISLRVIACMQHSEI
jgi:hypothetical protein